MYGVRMAVNYLRFEPKYKFWPGRKLPKKSFQCRAGAEIRGYYLIRWLIRDQKDPWFCKFYRPACWVKELSWEKIKSKRTYKDGLDFKLSHVCYIYQSFETKAILSRLLRELALGVSIDVKEHSPVLPPLNSTLNSSFVLSMIAGSKNCQVDADNYTLERTIRAFSSWACFCKKIKIGGAGLGLRDSLEAQQLKEKWDSPPTWNLEKVLETTQFRAMT